MPQIPTVLALDIGVLVYVLIVVVAAIGSAISKSQKKNAAKRLPTAPPASADPPTSDDVTLEELATQRRQQLQALAHQRTAGTGAQQHPSVQSLQQAQASISTAGPPTLAPPATPFALQDLEIRQPIEAARSQAEALRQRQAEAELAHKQRATQQSQASQNPGQALTDRHLGTLRSSFDDEMPVVDGDHETDVDISDVHRHVHDAVHTVALGRKRSKIVLSTDIKSLRQAIILRELLDPPLALRNLDETPYKPVT